MGSCLALPSASAQPHQSKEPLWQDRRLLWDQPHKALLLRPGEVVTASWDNVEDAKGRNGLGLLQLTNLRLIWTSNYNPSKNNISVGLSCAAYVHYNMIDSPTFGRVRATHVMSQIQQQKFEFWFVIREAASVALFASVEETLRRYKATRVFKAVVLKEASLVSLADPMNPVIHYGEEVLQGPSPSHNVAATDKFPGVMVLTSRRVIWLSTAGPALVNVSVPFIQMRCVTLRSNVFGKTLVIETLPAVSNSRTSSSSSVYVLGFTFAREETLDTFFRVTQTQLSRCRSEVPPFYGPLDGIVLYTDDRLFVVPNATTEAELEVATLPSGLEDESSWTGQAAVAQRNSLAALMADFSNIPLPSDLDSALRVPHAAAAAATDQIDPVTTAADRTAAAAESTTDELRGAAASETPLPANAGREDVSGRRMSLCLSPIDGALGENGFFAAAAKSGPAPANAALPMSPSSKKYSTSQCVVCLSSTTDVAFDPCGHLSTCARCSAKLLHCPICRISIDKRLRVFLHAA